MISARTALFLLLISLGTVCAQVTLSPDPVIGYEGGAAVMYCGPAPPAAFPSLTIRQPGGSDPDDFIIINSNDGRLTSVLTGDVVQFTYSGLMQAENGSSFQCISGVTPSNIITLLVYYVDVTPDTTSFTIPVGATVNVSFTVSSYPEVTELPTLKRLDGSPLSVTPVITADSVSLSNLQRVDAGNYNFVVSANISVGIGSFEIIVQFPPTYDFMGNPNPRPVLVVRGTDTTLDCSSGIMAEPNPTYSISTSASGTNVMSINTTTGIISITNAQSDNDGLYTCNASNTQGVLNGSALQFRVYVGTVPTAVTNLNISGMVPLTETDPLVITWSYTNDSGVPVTDFVINVDVEGIDQCADTAATADKPPCRTGLTNSLIITFTVPRFRFIKKTDYIVRVTPKNLFGNGAPRTHTFMTAGAARLSLSAVSVLLVILAAVLLQ